MVKEATFQTVRKENKPWFDISWKEQNILPNVILESLIVKTKNHLFSILDIEKNLKLFLQFN